MLQSSEQDAGPAAFLIELARLIAVGIIKLGCIHKRRGWAKREIYCLVASHRVTYTLRSFSSTGADHQEITAAFPENPILV